MTLTRGTTLTLAVAMSAFLADSRGTAAEAPAGAAVRLTAISSRTSANGASLVIETSEPVPYTATRPDPLTLVLDFRNADAGGLVPGKTPSPIAGVAVDTVQEDAPTSRVRIALTQPVAHRIRSNRNVVVVDFDKSASSDAASYVMPPSTRASQDAPATRASQDAMAALGPRAKVDPVLAATPVLPLEPPSTTAPVPPIAAAPARQAPVTGGAPVAQSAAQAPVQSAQATPPAAQAPSAGAAQTAPLGPATQTAAAPAEAPRTATRTYSGHPISFIFEGADLRAVLRNFAEISGLNIVIDPSVEGTVDVVLRDVPWDQALDQILRTNKLGYLVDGTIVRMAPLAVLEAEAKSQAALAVAQAEARPLTVWTHQLSYAKGEDIRNMLRDARILSERGEAFVDARTNTLVISDLEERISNASQLIATLDRPQPQVEIEARIIQSTRNFARQLGVQWGFTGKVDPTLGNTTNLAFPNNGALTGAVNLPSPGANSTVGLALGSVNGAFNLDIAITAAESNGDARVLSTPRVTTQNNVEAEIAQGEQIPYQVVSNNTTTINFQDAALILRVTPQITAAGTVIMKIVVDNGSRGPDAGFPPQPSIRTQRALTTVMVNDGETTVIGGIYASSETNLQDSTPGLSRIPLLGWLFKRDSNTDASSELLIFITPRIIR